MERAIYTEDHELFRQEFRKFCDREIVPHQEKWVKQKMVDREAWRKAGQAGFLCMDVAEEYGGASLDFRYAAVIIEEMGRVGETGFALSLHSDVVAPYIKHYGSDELKKKWLPKCVSGECVLAIAMTEPTTGSDLAAIKTTARREGDEYVINGSKTFISNGQLCDLVVVACKTDPNANPPHAGVSLILVEADRKGFVKGKNLDKMGMHSQDTSELFFEDVRVPVTNILGTEGGGFYMLMNQLQQERLVVALGCMVGAEHVLALTEDYIKQRTAFGKPISKFQHIRFRMAEAATEVEMGRVFVDKLVMEHIAGKNIVKEASMAKWWCSEMFKRTTDDLLQFFGGYGYMMEYPITKAYLDARVQMIFAGTNEIMKEIIARTMGL